MLDILAAQAIAGAPLEEAGWFTFLGAKSTRGRITRITYTKAESKKRMHLLSYYEKNLEIKEL